MTLTDKFLYLNSWCHEGCCIQDNSRILDGKDKPEICVYICSAEVHSDTIEDGINQLYDLIKSREPEWEGC